MSQTAESTRFDRYFLYRNYFVSYNGFESVVLTVSHIAYSHVEMSMTALFCWFNVTLYQSIYCFLLKAALSYTASVFCHICKQNTLVIVHGLSEY